ncbi:MAG: hypothetical protein RR816_09680 [Clostridia bacterium]
MNKKIIAFALSLIMCLTLCTAASAKDYSSEISSVMSSFVTNNYSCDSAPQQAVNGTYRTVEMLEIIAKELS